MKKSYTYLTNIGIYSNTPENEQKKIQLLNVFCLTWGISIICFVFLDYFFARDFYQSLKIHLSSFATLMLIYGLQKNKWYVIARVIFILALIIVTFIFSNYAEPLTLMENLYFMYPLVSLLFINKKWISISILIICWIFYFLPRWLITGEYPYHSVNTIVLALMVFIGNFVILNYFRTLNLKKEALLLEKKEELELAYVELEDRKQSELAHLQLKSLKAQMNPHFMFNAMNSIQNLVLKGDKQEAYNYLTKFSSLIRENLNMSEKSFVSFEEELSLLQKYLELEKLRFREEFEYEINEMEDIDDIKIPSMIIQPFVENSIKHGLLHKLNGVKRVKITFEIDEVFKCIIEDNGVGIEMSKEINKKNQNQNNSFSTKAIKDRLALLKDYYKTDIGFHYEQVKEGTKVIIKIPYKLME
ncbi:histidine kinase [uncultured Tenacibaculum sp.]|uniref:sensor histidine kinase n=1 Tax=uncultured Tenacibaculum sp. TaxID=174713 RepID=UPI0026063C00|nr:histidine kinase [uncultured Tenacibaculum sp.]